MAARCLAVATLDGSGSAFLVCRFQRAGFSPSRYPWVFAQLRINSIRRPPSPAVLVFFSQIGLSTFSTSAVSIAATGRFPITGSAYLPSEPFQSLTCLSPFQPALWLSMYSAAHWENVTERASLSFLAVLRACLDSMGSIPAFCSPPPLYTLSLASLLVL